MGNLLLPIFSKKIFYCETHVVKGASAFCLTHKMLICMSCIAKKDHFTSDCRIQELDDMNDDMIECVLLKQEIRLAKQKMRGDQIERKMKEKIEDAYNEALENLEQLKIASYEVTREEIANIISREDENTRNLCRELDKAIECYGVGNIVEAESLRRTMMTESFCRELDFEKVEPASGELQKSLVKVKEIRIKQMQPEETWVRGGKWVDSEISDNEDESDETKDTVPGRNLQI